ncbi:MAG: BlaI/MecI/CopY family transcriptional regulator [Chloroflexi bacterium]|nr:BlaI/MecI/CopY family transcriptional regulator [Chloroflexota bacterium]
MADGRYIGNSMMPPLRMVGRVSRVYTIGVARQPIKVETASPDINTVHMDRPGIRKVLGDLEAEIMELMWTWPNASGATVRDVFEVLQKRRPIAYTTVMNTMARLAKKRLLEAETSDLAYVYRPVQTQAQFVAQLVDRIVNDLLNNFSGETTTSLSKVSDRRTAKRARELLAEIERRKSDQAEKDQA